MAVSNFSPDLYVFSRVFPFFKFLNLMVVLAAPRACFMILKLRTFHGSPSISIVMPFLMSDVSMATPRTVPDGREKAVGAAGAKAAAEPARRARMGSFIGGLWG